MALMVGLGWANGGVMVCGGNGEARVGVELWG